METKSMKGLDRKLATTQAGAYTPDDSAIAERALQAG